MEMRELGVVPAVSVHGLDISKNEVDLLRMLLQHELAHEVKLRVTSDGGADAKTNEIMSNFIVFDTVDGFLQSATQAAKVFMPSNLLTFFQQMLNTVPDYKLGRIPAAVFEEYGPELNKKLAEAAKTSISIEDFKSGKFQKEAEVLLDRAKTDSPGGFGGGFGSGPVGKA